MVKEKKLHISITDKEKDMQIEKVKLLKVEVKMRVLENQKMKIEDKIIIKNMVLTNQSKVDQEVGNVLQKERNNLSAFKKNTTYKSKLAFKTISKQ